MQFCIKSSSVKFILDSNLNLRIQLLHRIIQEDILTSQLEQHRIVEEFVDGNILGETFASSRLDHELTSQMGGRLWFEGSNDNALVEWITGNDLKEIIRIDSNASQSNVSG